MTTDTQKADILWRAAELIDTGHHLKGSLGDGNGGYCANGAINMANHGSRQYQYTDIVNVSTESLTDVVVDVNKVSMSPYSYFTDVSTNNVVAWNNAPERTKEEVVLALQAAAISLDPSLANIGQPEYETEVTPIAVPVYEPVPATQPISVPVPDRELEPA